MSDPAVNLFFILLSTGASLWIMNRFWSCFYEKERASLRSLLPWFFHGAFLIFMQYERLMAPQPVNPVFPFLVNTLLMFLIVIWGFQSDGQETVFLFLLFCTVWALIELSLDLFLRLFHLDHYANLYIGIAGSMILMMTFSHIVSICRDRKYKNLTPLRFAFPLLLIPLGSLYIMIMQYKRDGNNLISAIDLSILLLFNLIIFHAYIRINQFFLQERENAVHREQLSLISQNMEEQKKLMEEFYEEKHNLINELTALQGILDQENAKEAARSLDKILGVCHSSRPAFSIGNSTINAILNAKYATAEKYGIAFRSHICVPEELSIEPCDLGVVIGNALDNAIAAVKKCTRAKRVIQISMGVKKNAFIMVVKNPYEHEIKRNRSGEILSDKPDGEKHGYGLRSIRRIAAAYAGDTVIETDQGYFVLTVVLNFV